MATAYNIPLPVWLCSVGCDVFSGPSGQLILNFSQTLLLLLLHPYLVLLALLKLYVAMLLSGCLCVVYSGGQELSSGLSQSVIVPRR